MDALALLCTLHADGPATLKNLRQAGCASLDAVESMEEDRLSRLLGGPPAVARRFVREARHLRERLGPGHFDREETASDSPPGLLELGDSEPVAVMEIDPGTNAGAVRGTELEGRDPVAEVLEAWSERDRRDSPDAGNVAAEAAAPQEDELPPRPVRARPEFEFGIAIAAAMREITTAVSPTRAAALAGPTAGSLDGLDDELCRSLGEAGIQSLEDLAHGDALTLSRRMDVGYTRIQRLVHLARRAGRADPGATASPAERPEPASATTSSTIVEAPPSPRLAEPTHHARVFPAKLSPSEGLRRSMPSILELEWNLEIQPTPPPAAHPYPEASLRDAERESAGGPFA